jgi:hypothetical protein
LSLITRIFGTVIFIVLALETGNTQMRPDAVDWNLPDPGPDRIEVRFAYNKKSVDCKSFHLLAKLAGKIILERDFSCGFAIPPEIKSLNITNSIELELQCEEHHWKFSQLSERIFLPGYWWVATDCPPFYERQFQGQQFKDAAWINFLTIEPTGKTGFTVWKKCPKNLLKNKSSPCYD